MADKDDTFFKELVEHHVSGKLKVAPEHVSKQVLKYMGKPAGETYDKFVAKFEKITKKFGKKLHSSIFNVISSRKYTRLCN